MEPQFPVYTAALAAFLLILQLSLMLTVGFARARTGVFLGEDGTADLQRLIRRHANLAENSGLFLAAIAILEIALGQSAWVAALAGGFALARTLHAGAFLSLAGSHGEDLTGGRKAFAGMRFLGAMGTALTGVVLAGALVTQVVGPAFGSFG
ncbi:MAG: MAPEG family protein [Pseudomonadota bacterium]